MATTHTSKDTGKRHTHQVTEAEAVLEQVIDTTLHTDRAHHDELGRTEEPCEPDNHPDEALPSPRERAAEPIDIQRVDE